MSKIKPEIKPENLPETLVWYYLLGTYPVYYLGAQLYVASLLAFVLTIYLFWKWWNQTDATNEDEKSIEKINISTTAWVWVISMLVIAFTVVVSHINFDLGLEKTAKTLVEWYRTWGLLAFFPLAGHLNIRPKLIYRGICILCLQSLLVILIGTVAGVLKIPNILYVSPLRGLGGDVLQFQVQVFHGVQERVRLFAVWPTFLALLGNIYFFTSQEEKNKVWRFIGMFTGVFLIASSQSRAASLCLPSVMVIVWILTNLYRPWVHYCTAFSSFLAAIFLPAAMDTVNAFRETFDKARAGSSETRHTIYRMSLQRWWNEAPIWGFGIRDEKPAYIYNLPLGTHHTWIGALYSNGLIGFVALSIAVLWTFVDLIIKAQDSRQARLGLKIFLVLFICSFADNLEYFSYLLWPGLLIMGIGMKEG
jgi:O-Antigen ligase